MTARFEGEHYIPKENIVRLSKVTRVTNSFGDTHAAVIHHGGSLTFRNHRGDNVTIRDEGDLGRAVIELPGESTRYVNQNPWGVRIEGIGRVEYMGKRRSL